MGILGDEEDSLSQSLDLLNLLGKELGEAVLEGLCAESSVSGCAQSRTRLVKWRTWDFAL